MPLLLCMSSYAILISDNQELCGDLETHARTSRDGKASSLDDGEGWACKVTVGGYVDETGLNIDAGGEQADTCVPQWL